jgi:ABC-2 type transport system permease protein
MSWRRLRTLIVREARATLRDRFTLAVLLLVPVMALLVFSSVLSTKVEHLRLGVFDASASSASRRIVAELAADGSFLVERYPSRDALERALAGGRISAGLVIPPAFERELLSRGAGRAPPEIQALFDGAETVPAGNADAFLRGLVAATGATLVARDLGAQAPRAGAGDGGGRGGSAGRGVRVITSALFNPTLEGRPFMVSGTFGFVLSFLTTIITAITIVNERLAGTFDQLQLTPATSFEILLGKLLPLGAIFAFDVVVMMGLAGLLLGVWPQGSAVFFVIVSAFYVLTSLALGLYFSATSGSPAEAVQKTVLTSLPVMQISGFVFPIRNMPAGIQWLAELLPATHYIRVCRGIYLRGEGPLQLAPELALLFLFGAVLVGLTLRTLARRA